MQAGIKAYAEKPNLVPQKEFMIYFKLIEPVLVSDYQEYLDMDESCKSQAELTPGDFSDLTSQVIEHLESLVTSNKGPTRAISKFLDQFSALLATNKFII